MNEIVCVCVRACMRVSVRACQYRRVPNSTLLRPSRREALLHCYDRHSLVRWHYCVSVCIGLLFLTYRPTVAVVYEWEKYLECRIL